MFANRVDLSIFNGTEIFVFFFFLNSIIHEQAPRPTKSELVYKLVSFYVLNIEPQKVPRFSSGFRGFLFTLNYRVWEIH